MIHRVPDDEAERLKRQLHATLSGIARFQLASRVGASETLTAIDKTCEV